ncbi:MAG: LamG-like jellyroll fold domain-containing protein [Thermoguttaceae bacterium]
MTQTIGPPDELNQLAAILCDGQITPEQAARLEELAGRSDAARQSLLFYLQLHGELYWDHAVGAGNPRPVEKRVARARRSVRLAIGSSLAAALAICVLGAWHWWAGQHAQDGPLPAEAVARPAEAVARIVRSVQADGAAGGLAASGEFNLAAQTHLDLGRGLVEIEFRSGATAVVEGPARLDLESPRQVFMASGRLTVQSPLAGFAVRTPQLTATDLGTQFGVAVEADGTSEVQVFAGAVEVRAERVEGLAGRRTIHTDQGVRIAGPGPAPIEQIASNPDDFLLAIPSPQAGSAAALRRLVTRHPNLIHHYTFEGASREEQYRDRRGTLHLSEVVMSGGRGGGAVRAPEHGYDWTTDAVAPYRAPRDGNSNGVALESEGVFQPPPQMTIEVLLRWSDDDDSAAGSICAAIATRESRRRCSFWLAAVDDGRLAHLADGEASWTEGEEDFAFIPGEWYYVIATFRAEGRGITVNTWAANLSRRDATLTWVVKDQLAPGVAAASRLGIGKGFDADLAHAYPWSGALDEIAIYDTVLDQKTRQEHFRALVGLVKK